MSSKTSYQKLFLDLLAIEERARDIYKYYCGKISDPYLASKFEEICADEEKHVNIAKEMLKVFS